MVIVGEINIGPSDKAEGAESHVEAESHVGSEGYAIERALEN